jgi:hydroxymethylpyrimidine/phosphomethylpyrimidine kinase
VLVLSGLDPGGGAGVLADARAITAAGAFACGVVTIQTIQSTRGMRRAEPVPARLWRAQARAVLEDQRVQAIKIGALGSADNVRAAAHLLGANARLPAVVDPVLEPTRGGGRLLAERALHAMRKKLLPRATLVTVNAPEAAILIGSRVATLEDARSAARTLVAMGARAALVKGGHLSGSRATDVVAVGSKVVLLDAPRIHTSKPLHGAGCTLASLIAARLALGADVLTAVRWAKRAHHHALARCVDVGGPLAVLSVHA